MEKDVDAALDQGLNIAGMGWYNFKICLLVYMTLLSSIFELNGYSMIMPAAKCDLNMSDKERGIIVGLPYVGIIVTSIVHGYLVDVQGRKKTLMYTTFFTGLFSAVAGVMPNLISFAIFKFLTALCLAGPCSTPFTYIAEITPEKHRDLLLTIANVGQISASAMVPFLSWVIRPLDIKIDLGIYVFRPWRLLNTVYASVAIISSFLLLLVPESPKFCLSQGKADEALKILQNIYVANTKKSAAEFSVKSLPSDFDVKMDFKSIKYHTKELSKWHYLKYMLLNGFLLFGLYAILNGLHMWVPDLMTRVYTDNTKDKTACEVIINKHKKDQSKGCDDSFNKMVFIINTCAGLICTVVAFILTMFINYCGKKTFLHALYFTMGLLCLFVNKIREAVIFTTIVTSFPLLHVGVGVIKAYSIHMFPVQLRGTAVCFSVMLGRLGSVYASILTGALLNEACDTMFNLYGALLIVCGTLAFFQPK